MGWFAMAARMAVLGGVLALGGCQQPQPPAPAAALEPVPFDGVGYLVFAAPIVPQSRDLFIADMTKLIDAGAREIHLGINSPGGDIDAAQGMVDFLTRERAQGVTVKTYNVGLVASAASYVFLVGQGRYTASRGAFVFHAAGLTSTGLVGAQVLREQADKLDAYERVVRAMLKSRTRLTDGETLTYVRRTVVLNADDARRDGIVDGIADYTVPKGARAWTIAVAPRRPATPAAAQTTAPPASPNPAN